MAFEIRREPHPWNARPGSENGPPTGDVKREQEAAAGARHELLAHTERFHPLTGGLPLDQRGRPLIFTTPPCQPPPPATLHI